jgi:hypothetical protein
MSFGTDNSGDITRRTRSLIIASGGDLATSSNNQGNAGRIWVNATDNIQISGQAEGGASAGILSLQLDRLILDGGTIETKTIDGKGGNLMIQNPD